MTNVIKFPEQEEEMFDSETLSYASQVTAAAVSLDNVAFQVMQTTFDFEEGLDHQTDYYLKEVIKLWCWTRQAPPETEEEWDDLKNVVTIAYNLLGHLDSMDDEDDEDDGVRH